MIKRNHDQPTERKKAFGTEDGWFGARFNIDSAEKSPANPGGALLATPVAVWTFCIRHAGKENSPEFQPLKSPAVWRFSGWQLRPVGDLTIVAWLPFFQSLRDGLQPCKTSKLTLAQASAHSLFGNS
jgi:hypothetical protein